MARFYGPQCSCNNVPVLCAIQVTGNANEDQILLAAETYLDAIEFVIQSLNRLFVLAKENTCRNQQRALQV